VYALATSHIITSPHRFERGVMAPFPVQFAVLPAPHDAMSCVLDDMRDTWYNRLQHDTLTELAANHRALTRAPTELLSKY